MNQERGEAMEWMSCPGGLTQGIKWPFPPSLVTCDVTLTHSKQTKNSWLGWVLDGGEACEDELVRCLHRLSPSGPPGRDDVDRTLTFGIDGFVGSPHEVWKAAWDRMKKQEQGRRGKHPHTQTDTHTQRTTHLAPRRSEQRTLKQRVYFFLSKREKGSVYWYQREW